MKSEIIGWLKNLNSDTTNPWPEQVKNRAPHKPFLLLSIIDGIEQGWITGNQIELSSKLTDTFFDYWNSIMGDRNTKVITPFTHLGSEPFWTLEDRKKAEIDTSFFQMLVNSKERIEVRNLLLREYFTHETALIISEVSEVSGEIWDYSKKLDKLSEQEFVAIRSSEAKRKLTKKETQIRDRSFSLSVRKHYNYTCAFCETKVITPEGRSIVEGAHIIPWTESYNDDPRNGISLCKNHHWLFDRWLCTIRDDFTIKVSELLKGSNRFFGVDEMENKKILLPKESLYKPAREALLNHNEYFNAYHRNL